MTPGTLSPASVKIDYTTLYGAHAMTIPTLDWNGVSLGGSIGSYLAWNGAAIDAETMVRALIAKLKVFALTTTTFDECTVYTMATPTSANIPRAGVALGVAGTSGGSGPSAAFSVTWMFKTLGNRDSKLVQLDIPVGTNWLASVLPAGFTADMLALETEFTSAANAWSGRDDTRPAILRKATFDVNDKLQKQYFH